MSLEIASKVMTPAATQPTAGGKGAAEGHGAEFRDRLGGAGETTGCNATANAQNLTNQNQVNPANATQQVNGGAQVPDKQDLFGRFERIRQDFDNFVQRSSELDKLVAEGKMKADDPKVLQQRHSDLRMLLHFQNEMQSASMQVEIASKVVEHATSGLKTMLSTSA